MNGSFTASQVRDHASADDYIGAWRKVLRAFADRLEADEKAVPVRQFRVVPKGSTWTDVKDDEIWAAVTAHPESYETRVLYTHSTQAQPPAASVTDAMVERAQDCLHDKGKDIGYYHMRAALEAALAAQENPDE